MGKHEEGGEDQLQTNKKHNKTRDKLKKRMERKKEGKKRLKEKRQAKLEAIQLRRERGEIDHDKAKRIVRALVLQKGGECLLQLPDLFIALDQGFGIELDGMTDPYVRHKLKKLAKALLLEKVEAEDSDGEVKTEYRKSELMKKVNLRRIVEKIIDRAAKDKEIGALSSENDLDSQKEQGEEEKKQEKEEEQVEEDQDEFIGPEIPHELMVSAVNEKSKEFLTSTSGLLEIQKKPRKQKVSSDVVESLKSIFEDSALDDQRKRPMKPVIMKQQTSFRQSSLASRHGDWKEKGQKQAKNQEDQERDDFLRAYMNEYNSMYRPKSLAEEYRELKQDKKGKTVKSQSKAVRRFDRDNDLNFGMVDSSRTFNVLHGKGSLSDKFGSGNKEFL